MAKDRIIQVKVSVGCWDRLVAQGPRDGVLTGEEWVSVALGRYAEEASRGGVLSPPVGESVARVEGSRLRVLRRAAGLTLRQVAAVRGVSFSWVGGLETGRFDQPVARAEMAAFYGTLLGTERVAAIWGADLPTAAPGASVAASGAVRP